MCCPGGQRIANMLVADMLVADMLGDALAQGDSTSYRLELKLLMENLHEYPSLELEPYSWKLK
jgi:hypothetical protein